MNDRRLPHAFMAVFVACLLALSFIAFPAASRASAAETQSQPTTVRVGYFSNGDFMHKTDDGTLEGYDIEYYYMLAGYADWDIQFVEYDNLDAALAGLEAGDVDVMSGLSITDERKSRFLISNQKMSTAHIAVQTRSDDDRFAPGDTATMTDMTCGILEGSNVVTLYENWCEANGLTPHVVGYATIEQRNAALAAGEVDAIAGGSSVAGAQKVAEFPSLDLYFMFNRDRSDLKSELDRAMSILSLENPTYASSLYEKYFPTTKNSTPTFTAAEKAFILEHPTIRVGVLENDAPFSSVGSDGNVAGILPDYFKHLGDVIGCGFECVPFASKEDACAALSAGDIDMVGKFESDLYQSNASQVILTIPYLRMDLVQITRVGTSGVTSAAVPQCNADSAAKTVAAQDSSVTLVSCVNSQECFDKLRSGDVDSVICTQPAATWLLYRNRASDYVVLAFGGDSWDASCALSFGDDGNTLRSILDKTITVDDGYINQLITSETLDDSASLATALDRIPVSMLVAGIIIALVLFVLAVIALIIIIRRRKTERLLEQQRAEIAAAEQVNKARHEFFSAVSHDMRTPLNGITGFADLALQTDDPARTRDCLTKIRKSSSVLNGLVDDMLVMSRIENGKYVINPVPNNTAELFEEVLGPIQVLADEKGVRFTSDMSGLHPRTIMVDRLSLQKVVLNLLSNAVKFTPAGGTVTLKCTFDPREGPDPDTVITVSDMGPGISREFMPHIFEPFSQENPENADTSGSGMGLTIAKSIVDAMGGTIDARSERGEGTTFTVRLHLEEVASPVFETPAEPNVDTGVLAGKCVLVCEDNELNLEICRNMLERCGVEVVSACNGELGVDAFASSGEGTFDAVLLDLRMPVMDGRKAARAIRALDREDAKAVPIIAISADAFAQDVQECLDAGMNGHVAKPIDPQNLYRTLVANLREG